MIVDCYGRLVFGEETTELRRHVKELLATNPRIVLNLRDLTFMDSAGMGTLVGLFASSYTAGGKLKLAHLGKHIREVLYIAKLISVFEVFPDEYAAVKSFQQHA